MRYVYWLTLELLSDTAPGRGDGVAGLVDAEVQHDAHGLPFISGKTLKGLLMAQSAEIVAALPAWKESARCLWGTPGSRNQHGNLHVGNALLPQAFRQIVSEEFAGLNPVQAGLRRQEYLDSLTTLRRQTAMDETGAPQKESLRTIRVILRETIFESRLEFLQEPEEKQLALLAACVASFRRLGSHVHRGLGKVKADLFEDANRNASVLQTLLKTFEVQ